MFAADKPIRHVEDDEYGREKYVDNLAYALLTGDDSDGLVVGIEGEWGSGKTSLKNMLIERLQQMPLPDRKTHLIEFDAWMYSRSGEIVSALFSEISAGLSLRLKWYQKLLMMFDCFNNNAITSVIHLIYRAINAVLPYFEIGISIGCISWSFQNLFANLQTLLESTLLMEYLTSYQMNPIMMCIWMNIIYAHVQQRTSPILEIRCPHLHSLSIQSLD